MELQRATPATLERLCMLSVKELSNFGAREKKPYGSKWLNVARQPGFFFFLHSSLFCCALLAFVIGG